MSDWSGPEFMRARSIEAVRRGDAWPLPESLQDPEMQKALEEHIASLSPERMRLLAQQLEATVAQMETAFDVERMPRAKAGTQMLVYAAILINTYEFIGLASVKTDGLGALTLASILVAALGNAVRFTKDRSRASELRAAYLSVTKMREMLSKTAYEPIPKQDPLNSGND